MTVRDRLVETLREKLCINGGIEPIYSLNTRAVLEDVADALLAMPDIAIVEAASTLSEEAIAHVLADIDQVSDEDAWSLTQRLETIQKICGGSEYG